MTGVMTADMILTGLVCELFRNSDVHNLPSSGSTDAVTFA